MCCVFSSHLFWTSRSLDVPAGSHRRKITQDFSSTFLLRCMPFLLGIFFKSQLPGFELTSQRVRRLRGYQLSYRGSSVAYSTILCATVEVCFNCPFLETETFVLLQYTACFHADKSENGRGLLALCQRTFGSMYGHIAQYGSTG